MVQFTPPPALPSLNSPSTFNSRAIALFQWLTSTFIPEAEAVSADDFADFSPVLGHRNKIINGQFGIWQRGTSFTANDYTADRWLLQEGAGAACTVSRQSFAVGQTDVPGDPVYFLRFARGTAGTAESFVSQRIEDVRTLSGQTATVTFWVKASAATEIDINLNQSFGSGGSASTLVNTAVSTGESVATSWTKKSFSVSIPSINGKSLDGADDYLALGFYRQHDSTNPTADVDIANVSLVGGDATNEADPGAWRDITTELLLAQRYYTVIDTPTYGYFYGEANDSFIAGPSGVFSVQMRTSPTATFGGSATYTNCVNRDVSVTSDAWQHRLDKDAVDGLYRVIGIDYQFDAEL